MLEEKPSFTENTIYEFIPQGYYTSSNIETIVKKLLSSRLSDITHMESVLLFLCDKTNNLIEEKIATVKIESGIIKRITINKTNLGSAGEVKSFFFADLEEGLRKKVLSQYLSTAYLIGLDLEYSRLRHTDNVTEPFKISGALNIKNAPVFDMKTGLETGEKETIIKKPEFSKELDPNMIIRCMDNRITGVHTIYVYREFIQQCLNNLITEHKALIYLLYMPGKKIQGLGVKQDELNKIRKECSEKNDYTKFKLLKREAFNELLKIIIDDEREYMSKKLGLYASGGMINQNRVGYIVNTLPNPQPEQKSKSWYKKKGIDKK